MGPVSVRPHFLLDSTLLIDHLNGIEAARRFLLEAGLDSCVSFITVAETLAGAADKERDRIRDLLRSFAFLAADFELADEAARLRAREKWKLPDAFQAALALREGLRLVTRNTRDFPPDRYSFVYVPYG